MNHLIGSWFIATPPHVSRPQPALVSFRLVPRVVPGGVSMFDVRCLDDRNPQPATRNLQHMIIAAEDTYQFFASTPSQP